MNFDELKPLPVTCRQSSIGCARDCERKWLCQYRLGIKLRGGEYKEAATLGQIYHRLQCLGPGQEYEVRAEIRKQQSALMAGVERGEDLDGNMARLASKLTTLYQKAEVMARVFWKKFPEPDYFTILNLEVKHSMEWQDGLFIEGTIDKLLVNEQDDFVWIRDHKSTGRPLSALFGGLSWSLQGRLYRILAEDYIGTTNRKGVKGFILDGIITPGIKLCRTDEKNAKIRKCSVEEAYLRRVVEWYESYEVKAELANKANAKALDSKAMLFTEPLYPKELTNLLTYMAELKNRPSLHPSLYARDVTRYNCFKYEKQCIYHDLCSTDPDQWDELFEKKYKFTEPKPESREVLLNKIMTTNQSADEPK